MPRRRGMCSVKVANHGAGQLDVNSCQIEQFDIPIIEVFDATD
jgi:hypothetical protein